MSGNIDPVMEYGIFGKPTPSSEQETAIDATMSMLLGGETANVAVPLLAVTASGNMAAAVPTVVTPKRQSP